MKTRNIFVTFILVTVVLTLSIGVSGATWCDSDFAKRINVSVNNTGGSALTDYQVYVNLSANPINETSLRVYNATGCTLRSHWTENETGGNSYGVWINYSAIAASVWVNNTAIYYDNPAKSSISNITTTFLFGDSFDVAIFDVEQTEENYFVDDIARYGASDSIVAHQSIHYGDRVYFVLHGENLNPYAMLYNITTGNWSDKVYVGENPLGDDGHGTPTILRDASGYLHIFYGSHGSAQKYAKSTNPDNITSWTAMSDPFTGTYPTPRLADNGDIYVFYRTHPNGHYAYKNSSNGGSSWSAETVVITSPIPGSDCIYAGYTAHQSGAPEKMHIGWMLYDYDYDPDSTLRHRDVFYVYLNLTDWHMYNVSGTDLGVAISGTEADNSCKVFVGNPCHNIKVHMYSGVPYIIFNHNANFNFTKWTGSTWTSPQTITTTDTWQNSLDFLINTSTDIEGYFDTGNTIEKWDYNGATWSRDLYIANGSDYDNNLCMPAITYNHTDDFKLVFSQCGYGNDKKAFAYGDSGFTNNTFETNTSDKWQSTNTSLYTVSVGNLILNYVLTTPEFTQCLNSKFSFNNYITEARVKAIGSLSCELHVEMATAVATIEKKEETSIRIGDTFVAFLGGAYNTTGTGVSNTWYRSKISVPSSGTAGTYIYSDDLNTLHVSKTGTPTYTTAYIALLQTANDTGYADWIFVRKYASSEPSVTLGSEEDQPTGTTPVISNVINGSISPTSQYINWTVNQTAHNRVKWSNESDLTPAWYSTWDNSTNTPNITLSGLDASTQYWYQAWSYNTTNNSLNDNSSTLSFTTAAESVYVPPDPTTLANTTGNFWINHTWNNGTGNKTDSYNVSVNTTWYNTTTNEYYNNTGLSAHGWSNITVYAFNSSGTGVLSNGNISQDTQVPNNVVTISNCSNKDVIETQNIYVDIDSSDVDGDTPTYSCNRTDLFTDFGTASGKGNWSTDTLDNGTYYVNFGVSDGYGSTDNCTVTIEVAEGTPTVPTNLNYALTNGNQTINWTWDTGSNTDKTNATLNGTAIGNITSPHEYTNSTLPRWENLSIRGYNSTTDEYSGWLNETVYVLASTTPTLHIGNAMNIQEDWGRDFNSNLSANVTVANASGVWMNFSNVEFTNTSLGWLNLTLDEWVNGSHNVNSPVTNISVTVTLNSTTSGATNDSDSFWYEVTKRTNTATMDSAATQSVNQSEDFWINTSVNEEYGDIFYGSADLLEDFNIIATNTSVINYVNFSHNESVDGYYHYRVRFYNLTHYENVTTTYSNVTANDAPAAPTGLHNTSYNHSSISTDWDDNAEPDIAGYKLYRNESLAYNGSNSEHYDSGLNPDTLYQYKVQAYDTYGKYGVNCSVVNMSTMQTNYPPPDPINLANNTGNFWINHTWNAGSGYVTDSYNVSIGAVWYNTTTTTYYNDSGLSAHAWSNVTVWAYNSSGPGSLSFGSISDDVRIPNNVPVLSGLPDNTTTEDVNQTDIFDLDDYFTDADGDTPTYQVESNNQSAYVSVTINASNNVSYTLASGWNGTAEVVINVTDGWDGEDNDTFLIIVNAPPLPGDYIPGDPTTLQNTTGNYWVNYTWIVGGGNVTDSYNVSWNLTWYNNTLVPYMNDSVGAEGWANITVSAYNSSGNGSLSAGYISDEVQAPTAPPGDYPPATPTTLANTTGNGWVNYTWNSGGGANVTDSYNVSWNLTWYNTTIVAYMNDSVGEFGWANISVWAYNTSGNGSLSPGSVSDNTQAGGGTYITSMTTTVYNLITYYGSSSSSAEQFGIDIGSVDYIAMYNGSFYTHSMGYIGYNFTTVHGIGYYVYLNATGSSTYSRNNISDTPYNTQLFNRWNTVGWTNATDTNAEGVASSIGSACKYTSSLNADGITYATHTVGFTSNNHAVEKGEGYWVWVNTGVSWGRNN